MSDTASINRRILLVDDNAAIHEDFHKVLSEGAGAPTSLDDEAMVLFGGTSKEQRIQGPVFQLSTASQGQEALELVRSSLAAGRPYAMVFVDMRMPPGWDGLETIQRIWEIDQQIETVVCTAYSDYSWQDLQRALKGSDRLLILKKPFDRIEVMQMAMALTEKWNLRRLATLQLEGLEQMVRSRTKDLIELNKSKCDLLANISHELLTPMNGILGMTSLLETTALSEEQRDYVDGVNVSGQRLLLMLQQVLKFNQIEAGRLTLNRTGFDLRALCQGVVDAFTARAQAKGLSLVVRLDPALQEHIGDAEQVRSVLSLLVENAIKFTSRGTIQIQSRASATVPGACELSVIDSGSGIDPARLELLNHNLIQLDSGTGRQAEGIGLGLTLTKQILHLMQSHLEIQSEAGKGSTFSFLLGNPQPPEHTSASERSAA
jgi:signal transduction histidine kinase